ncbi:unnamed protein product [Aureobasidium pullulans]|nr:unnamed protein product [Aureobasidium pullulans]
MDDEESHRLILRLLNEDLVSIQASSRHSTHSDTFVAATLARQELRTAHQQINDLRTARIISREEVSQREAVRANEISARLLFRQLNPDEPLPNPLTDHQMAIAEALDQSPTAVKAESNASPYPQPTSSALPSQPTTSFGCPRPSLKRSADDLIDAEVPPSKKHESDQIGIDVTLPGPSDTARNDQTQSQYQHIYLGIGQRGSLEHDRLSGVVGETPVAPSSTPGQFTGFKRSAEEETPTSRPTKKQDSRHDIVEPRRSDSGDAAAPSPLEISSIPEIDTMAEASHGFSFTSVRVAPFEYPTVSEKQSSTPPAPLSLSTPLPSISPPRSLSVIGVPSESTHGSRSGTIKSTVALKRRAVARFGLKVKCWACHDKHHASETLMAPCEHHYCRDCINSFLETTFKDNTTWPPRCCKTVLSYNSVQHLLTPENQAAYLLRRAEMDTPVPERTYCRVCATFLPEICVSGNDATCNVCDDAVITCVGCKNLKHGGLCERDSAERESLKVTAKEQGWKECPLCHSFLEHIFGCWHMT